MRRIASNPTQSSGGSEKKVSKIPGSEPWETGKDASYQYYPFGDTSAEKKDAPSPLHVSIIPNVNLPKVLSLHLSSRFNSYEFIGASRSFQQVWKGRISINFFSIEN
jgi:hypothetical protein